MILTFKFADEYVKVKIIGTNISFASSQNSFASFVPIESLQLSKEGIMEEFPDIKKYIPEIDFSELKKEAIRRQKWLIQNLGGEKEIKQYVIDELSKRGYKLVIEE